MIIKFEGIKGEKMLEKFFKLKQNNTDVKTEITAGITTFMTMAYILAVNPSILSDAGMDANAVLIATCLASFIGTACMAFMANMPFAPDTVVLGQGLSWQVALFAVFVEGLIFIFMSLTNMREAIFNSIPLSLKKAVSVGIGLFIAFIGLQNAGLAVDASTLVTITSFTENFSTKGICALLAIIGLFITAILHIRNIKGGILYGIVITWGLGMLCQVAGIYVPDPAVGAYSLFPSGLMSADFSALGKTFGQCFKIDFSSVGLFNFIVILFSFLFVDLFDTLGTLIGVCSKADMLDENGRMSQIKPALLSDAIATSAGAVLGTSTVTTFVESSAGVAVGGRTGLTALTTGILFLLATLFSPLFTSIPSFATAPALIFVGFLMFEAVVDLNFSFEKRDEAIPAYLCILAMPLFYSISEGICLGIISYTVLKAATGKAKEVNPIMYVLTVLFVLKYIFL